jgi:asparagine synthase (glutamine-hydrolysing)
MCGIAGVVSDDPALRDPAIVRAMLDSLAHRGPDDEGVLTLGPATLGARRLSIVDIAGGHQPITDASGRIAAVQNGELYNYLALRDELQAKGYALRTRSDTEVLPSGYDAWGDALAERVHGMFAFAVWDDARRTLHLARDRFGKKPLVYARVPGAFVFASEIQALLRHPAVPRDIDEFAIAAYLSLGHIPAPRSAFAAIRKLPPASTLTLHGADATVRRYWRLQSLPKLELSMADAEEQLRARIDTAVRLRLMGEVPIGVFLSGGLDSSTVVAFMSRHMRRVRTFAVGFTDARLNELAHARAVAQAFGTEHEELVVDSQDVDVLPMLIRNVGEPFADSSIVPTYHVARMTRPHVTVALTGDGGDELFLGYDRYRAALMAERLSARLGPMTGALASLGAALPTGHRAPPRLARAGRFLSGLRTGGADRYLRWSGYFTHELRDDVIGDRLRSLGDPARADVISAYDAGAGSEAERYAMADVELGLPGDLLTKMDIATMSASLEARSPLLDHELAEFVARLPAAYKMAPGRSKIVLRNAMAGILPPAIVDRGKSGFVAPVGAWLRGPLRNMFLDVVPSGEAVRRGWVTREGVARAQASHDSGRTDRTRHLWSLLVLEIWWREMARVTPAVPAGPAAAAILYR